MIPKIKDGADPAPAAPKTAITVAWERLIREKTYVKNLSPATIYDYGCAWNSWSRWLPADPAQISERVVEDVILSMRSAGLSAISTNSYLRVLKAFVRWLNILGEDGTALRSTDDLSTPSRAPHVLPRRTPVLVTRDLSNVHEQFSPLGAALRGRRR